VILALDLGSTCFKAALVGEDDAPRAEAAVELRYDRGSGGRVELPVAEAERSVRRLLGEVLRTVPAGAGPPRALAVTSQAQTFTVVDAQGRPRLPFLSWQDTRSREVCRALASRPELADAGAHGSFAELDPGLQLCQLARLREAGEGPASGERVLPLPGWLIGRLTDRCVTDDNLAPMTGLYSLRLDGWWPQALAAAGVTAEMLPAVLPVGALAGRLPAERYGLPAGLPVVLAGNDQTAGACGAGLQEEGGLLITLGTAQVAYLCTEEVPPPRPGTVRGRFPGGRGYRLVVDPAGGNLVNWAKTVLAGCATDEAFFARAAAAAPDPGDLAFVAELQEGRGAWTGMGVHHTAGDLARALLAALCRRMAALVARLEVDAAACRCRVAGGGSAAELWVRMLAAELGAELSVTGAGPLLGAARLARRTLAREEEGEDEP
jgi:xylulokinase